MNVFNVKPIDIRRTIICNIVNYNLLKSKYPKRNIEISIHAETGYSYIMRKFGKGIFWLDMKTFKLYKAKEYPYIEAIR